MFPDITLPPEGANTLPSPSLGKVFLFDFEDRRYVLVDGKPVEATYEQAIQQWVTLLLITELDQYPIYTGTDFGMQFKHFIGRRDLPIGIVNSELRRQLEEKALQHPEITGIDNMTVTRVENKARFSFQVQTLRGLVEGLESEVIVDGRTY
jgi:hypothetical protein